jgi:hypothetical protein
VGAYKVQKNLLKIFTKKIWMKGSVSWGSV